jgi:hypothetical protein
MTKKIFSLVLMFGLVLAVGFSANQAEAQVATFPAGCSSALGYSVTTGLACNGTATATIGFLPGCSTALGYSTVNGVPCSGGPVAIFFLAGCTSIQGYSIITGAPCNGTSVATPVTPVPGPVVVIPGLPVTGGSSNTIATVFALMASGIAATYGLTRFARRSNKA